MYQQIPTDAEGIADAVLELSTTCFDTPFEEQPQSLVKPQLYRYGGDAHAPAHCMHGMVLLSHHAAAWPGCLLWSLFRMESWQSVVRSSTCCSTAGCDFRS